MVLWTILQHLQTPAHYAVLQPLEYCFVSFPFSYHTEAFHSSHYKYFLVHYSNTLPQMQCSDMWYNMEWIWILNQRRKWSLAVSHTPRDMNALWLIAECIFAHSSFMFHVLFIVVYALTVSPAVRCSSVSIYRCLFALTSHALITRFWFPMSPQTQENTALKRLNYFLMSLRVLKSNMIFNIYQTLPLLYKSTSFCFKFYVPLHHHYCLPADTLDHMLG